MGHGAFVERKLRCFVGAHDELRGKGNLLYVAGRRGADGARGGLLPLCGLQSLVGPRERPGDCCLPVLRYGVCGRGWAGRRKVRFPEDLAAAIKRTWGENSGQNGSRLGKRFVVCTGGEPLLQLDTKLIAALHERDFEIAVESNGTIAAPAGVDWLCISPKAGAELAQRSGDELKLVYPQAGADPAEFERLPFRHFFLQPMDGPSRTATPSLPCTIASHIRSGD